MKNILNKSVCLKLNRLWIPAHFQTVEETFVDFSKGTIEGVDIEWPMNEDGTYNFKGSYLSLNSLPWKDWMGLPIRPHDLFVGMPHQTVRVPSVVVCVGYDKAPLKKRRLNARAIFERDKGICQYTGRYVGWKGGNVDHIIPQSKGGRTIWTNLVWCDRKINSMKGNRSNEECGLKLIKQPKAPSATPVVVSFADKLGANPDWNLFLFKKERVE